MSIINVLFTLLFSTALVLSSKAQNWQQVRIDGMGFVTGIIINPSNSNEVYARTDVGGIFQWNSATSDWIGLLDMNKKPTDWRYQVESFAINPNTSGSTTVMYAAVGSSTSPTGTQTGILKSVDRGQTWALTSFPNTVGITGNDFWRHCGERLVIDKQNPNYLYYGTRSNGLYYSTDGGTTWANRTITGITNGGQAGSGVPGGIAFVAIDDKRATPSTVGAGATLRSTYIYVGVIDNISQSFCVYQSSDGGATFTLMNGAGAPPNTQNPIRGVVNSNGVLFMTSAPDATNVSTAGQGFINGVAGDYGGRIYKYVQTTNTWSTITPPGCNTVTGSGSGLQLTYACAAWAGIAVDPLNPNTIYAHYWGETAKDLYKSLDGGTTWRIVTIDPVSLYTAATWQGSTYTVPAWGYVPGAGTPAYWNSWPGGIAVDAADSKIVWFTNGYAVFRTTDITAATVSWTAQMKGFEELVVNQLKAPPKVGGKQLFSGVADVGGFVHTNVTAVPGSMYTPARQTITTGIDYCFNNPDYIAKVGGDQAGGVVSNACTGCGFSTDNGTTWTAFTAPAPAGTDSPWGVYSDGNIAVSSSLVGSPAKMNLVWFPAHKAGTGGENKPKYSMDNGSTWTNCVFNGVAVYQPQPTAQMWFPCESVASDKVNSQTFYTYLNTYYDNTRYAYSTLWRTTDGGANWYRIWSDQKTWNVYGNDNMRWPDNYLVQIKPNPATAGDVWIAFPPTGTNTFNFFRCSNALATITASTPLVQQVTSGGITKVYTFTWGAKIGTSVNYTLYVHGIVNGVESIYASTNLGVAWVDIASASALNVPMGLSTNMEGDFRIPGRVYLSTSGRGIWYVDAISALPIDLLSFQVSCNGNYNLLNWSFAGTSTGYEKMIVEKNINGIYVPVATLTTTAGKLNYSYSDMNSDNSESLYRLHIIEDDRDYYSNIVGSNCQNESESELTVYPNPFNDDIELHYSGIEEGQVEIEVTDIQGKTLFKVTYMKNDYSITKKIVLADLAAGVYLVSIKSLKEKKITKIVKN